MKRTTATPLLFVTANLAASALVAATALLSAPAFASGYGPQPSYEPTSGAPASQRGPSVQTLAAEQHTANVNVVADNSTRDTRSESGRPAPLDAR